MATLLFRSKRTRSGSFIFSTTNNLLMCSENKRREWKFFPTWRHTYLCFTRGIEAFHKLSEAALVSHQTSWRSQYAIITAPVERERLLSMHPSLRSLFNALCSSLLARQSFCWSSLVKLAFGHISIIVKFIWQKERSLFYLVLSSF